MWVLQAQQYPDFNFSAQLLRRLCIPNIMLQPVPNRPLDYYTCAFRMSKIEKWAPWKPQLFVSTVLLLTEDVSVQFPWQPWPWKFLHQYTKASRGETWEFLFGTLRVAFHSLVYFRRMRFWPERLTAKGSVLRWAWTGCWMRTFLRQLSLFMRLDSVIL